MASSSSSASFLTEVAQYNATLPGFLRDLPEKAHELSQKFEHLQRQEGIRGRNAYEQDSPFCILPGLQEHTRRMNRYTDILPYQCSLVRTGILATSSTGAASNDNNTLTYLNASRITAPASLRSSLPPTYTGYIATQAPLPTTRDQFWRMVFEQDSRVIVCLTAVSPDRQARARKAEQYWPNAGQTDIYPLLSDKNVAEGSKLVVKSLSHQSPDVIKETLMYQTFELSVTSTPPGHLGHGYSTRQVMLVHYQGWPDHGVPNQTREIREMLREIQAWKQKSLAAAVTTAAVSGDGVESTTNLTLGPTVVHCSAGCGRTGTFCAVDTALSVLETAKYPAVISSSVPKMTPATTTVVGSTLSDSTTKQAPSQYYDWQSDRDLIQESVSSFRKERMMMVQTGGQYQFCYAVVRDLCEDLKAAAANNKAD